MVDGDTIEISPKVDGKDTVNLIGIDAPEEETASCGAQPLAQAATDRIAAEKGTKVKLEFDEDRTESSSVESPSLIDFGESGSRELPSRRTTIAGT